MRVAFTLFVLAIFAGVAVTNGYVKYLRKVNGSLAQRWFTRGEEAMARSYPAVAVEDYRNALSYDASNQQYRLKLAEALNAGGRLQESRAYLLSLWSQDPADAKINLDLARVYARENKPQQAIRYYRMAIDGVWPADPLQNRMETRFELVQFLAQHGARSQAIAELITLQAEAPPDPQAQLRVADLLLQFGEYARAAKTYGEVLKSSPDDVHALSGAGEAALALGDYGSAVRFLTAASVAPGSLPGTADQLAVAREALDADPYLRTLSLSQRAARISAAFSFAMQRLEKCAAQHNLTLDTKAPLSASPSASPNPLQLLYDSGVQRQAAATPQALHRNPDNMASTMDFVFDVLLETRSICPLQTPKERALDLIAQQGAHEQR